MPRIGKAVGELRRASGGFTREERIRERSEKLGELLRKVGGKLGGGAASTIALNFEPIAALAIAWVVLGQAVAFLSRSTTERHQRPARVRQDSSDADQGDEEEARHQRGPGEPRTRR